MCKLGDIIVVKEFTYEFGEKVKKHSFVVINDEYGTIKSLDYNFVASIISDL